MSRIRKGYEARFRSLLQRAGARRIEQGIRWLVEKARRLSEKERVPLTDALGRVCAGLARRTQAQQPGAAAPAIRFFCDAGLGGLARWLRAAGYEALWEPDIADDALLWEARRLSATILTTDSMMMERRLLRERIIPAFWLPPTLSIAEQLALVFCEFNLKAGQPRCMSCGGQLRQEKKKLCATASRPKLIAGWTSILFAPVAASCSGTGRTGRGL